MDNDTLFFETLRSFDYEIYHIEYHKQRIARTIGINLALEEYLYPPSAELLRIKVIYNRSGILDISYIPYIKKEIHSFQLVYDNTLSYATKKLDRGELEALSLHKGDCDEIMIFQNGFLTDTSIANIALFVDDIWITPREPLLFGTTLHRYLQAGSVTQKDITQETLMRATKIGLLNAMIDFDIIEKFTIKGLEV